MTEVLGEFNDYSGFQRLMRARAESLGISRATLDAIAGTHDGHAGKMLSDPPSKNMGIITFGWLVQGLAVKCIMVEDTEQRRKLANQLEQRDANNGSVLGIAKHAPVEIRISRREMGKRGKMGGKVRAARLSESQRRKIARLAGKARAAKMTPRQRSESASKASRARWRGNRPLSV